MKQKLRTLAIAASLVFSTAAIATDTAESQLTVPPLLEKLKEEGAKLHKVFRVSDHLNGYAMTIGSDQVIVYATPDGKHLFNGALLDNNSTDLTKAFEKKHLPQPDYSSATRQLEKAATFDTHDKDGSKTLYVLHDPNCPYCKRAFGQIMAKGHKSGIHVRWIPVAALGEDSLSKGSVMLASQNPVQLQKDFDNGYRPNPKEVARGQAYRQEVMDNTKLLKLIGASGTPAFVLVDNETQKALDVIHGYRPAAIERIWP